MSKKSEAYIEEELLSALLDGELFGDRAKEVKQAVLERDELKFQLRGLDTVSSQFRKAYSSELGLAWPGAKPDLWSSLERSIKREISTQQMVLPSFSVNLDSIRSGLSNLADFLQRKLLPTVGAFAVACLLVLVGINYLGDKQIESTIVAANTVDVESNREIALQDLISELSSSRSAIPAQNQLNGKFGVGRSRPESSAVHFVSGGHLVGSGKSDLPANLFSEQLIDPDKLSVEPEISSSKIEWINSDRPFRLIKCKRERSHPPVVWIGKNE